MDWNIEVIVVPVSDLERAKHFYHQQLGFVVDHDTRISEDYRLVQLTPPGSGCSIVLSTNNQNMAPGSLKGMQIVVADLDAAYAQLTAQAVKVSPIQHFDGSGFVVGRGGDWNNFIFFSDPDGNEWAIQERSRQ